MEKMLLLPPQYFILRQRHDSFRGIYSAACTDFYCVYIFKKFGLAHAHKPTTTPTQFSNSYKNNRSKFREQVFKRIIQGTFRTVKLFKNLTSSSRGEDL